MIVRIKVEQYYEVEVPDGTIDAIKDELESTDAIGEAKIDRLIRDKADYFGRDVYFEDARNLLIHNYTLLDVY